MPSTAASALAVTHRARRVSDAAVDAAIHAAIGYLNAGKGAAARACLAELDDDPPDSDVRCNLVGLIVFSAADSETALAWFDRALARNPIFADALVNRGLALHSLGRLPEGLAAFEAATQAGATDPSIAYNRGNILRALGRLDEAIACYDMALAARPAYPEALRAGGLVLRDAGRLEPALEFLAEALRLRPAYAEACLDLGGLLQRLDRPEAAVAAYEACLAAQPGNADLLNNLAVALQRLGRPAAALERLDAAIRAKPTLAEAHFNRGNALLQLQQPDVALAAYGMALTLRPGYTEALCSRAVALKYVERFDEALTAFDVALAHDPRSAHAKNNKAALLLLRGDFERGLDDYEFRWIAADTPKQALRHPIPEWAGRTRPGDRILVIDEQGLGNVIQFCRYLPLLAAQGADVTFLCRPKMHRLLRGLSTPVRLIEAAPEAEAFDYQIALSSLPRTFRTRLDTIPAAGPYLRPEPALAQTWATRLGSHGLRIGLCWQGNLDPRADPSRSIPLSTFAPLAAVPGVRLIAIQKMDGAETLAETSASMRIETPGADFDAGPDAFVDTAAIMQNLDLIVTCDTSVPHLAGALGRPVWVLLKRVPDWRWLLDRPDSPWYPTMRLYRQSVRGDWAAVVARIAATLQAARAAASI